LVCAVDLAWPLEPTEPPYRPQHARQQKRPITSGRIAISMMITISGTATTPLITADQNSALIGSSRRCQSNAGSSTRRATAISRAAIYAARARHSAKAAEQLCL
jgi:hypothetical protein